MVYHVIPRHSRLAAYDDAEGDGRFRMKIRTTLIERLQWSTVVGSQTSPRCSLVSYSVASQPGYSAGLRLSVGGLQTMDNFPELSGDCSSRLRTWKGTRLRWQLVRTVEG